MTVWLEVEGKRLRVELPADAQGGALQCSIDGRVIEVDAQVLEPGVISLIVEGRQYRCVLDGDAVVIGGRRFGFAVDDPRSLRGRRGVGEGGSGPRAVKAPMPGRVVRVLVAEGDEVAEQQGVVVIEAMKMQNELKSPKAGRVVRVAVAVDGTVGSGDVLVVVE
ncbi:biotin/lipoyl-containing protein [Edaphobacter aggregans]|uniref:biotin/lipoyl-containing protein n=1 Tax=Edaphobacter aggregans TaxID=570835 RepID=UPI00068E5016|nr:acetyl-CoA carboxylase biotin carboxyl carrier protein subunit [Edaphobacter aggregans]